MKEYIEREAAKKAFCQPLCYYKGTGKCEMCPVDAIPAADVVEVRHGEWIYDCERTMGDGWTYKQYHCSACGKQEIGAMQNYCPNCGAKMDGGEAGED